MGKKGHGKRERLSVVNWTPFEKVTLPASYPTSDGCGGENPKGYRNNLYFVVVYFVPQSEVGPGFHLSVKRNDLSPIRDWREFQRIKNELLSEEAEAVDLFPAESRLRDIDNTTHLWSFQGLARIFGYKERLVSESGPGLVQSAVPGRLQAEGLEDPQSDGSPAKTAGRRAGEGGTMPPRLVTEQQHPQKVTHTQTDTIHITPEIVKRWKNPPFQRPLKVNKRVEELAKKIAEDGGVLPGMVTLGVLDRERYLIDGQHRREAFLISGCAEGYTDIRLHHFDTMADMGQEFVNLNSQLVRLDADDILRGLESSSTALTAVRKKCPFVGYDNVRRGAGTPLLSMSALLRCWLGSAAEAPTAKGSVTEIAKIVSNEDAAGIADFLTIAIGAWGKDPEHYRLWGNLNLALCMWLYRRIVVTRHSPRTTLLTKEQFGKCLMSLAADAHYSEWLLGRQLTERDRPPAYRRIKEAFVKRLAEEMPGKKAVLPAPWGVTSGSH